MPYKDRNKQLAYQRKWNKAYYEKNRLSERQRIITRKQRLGEWLFNYRSGRKCVICGESEPCCLDFHHKLGTKKDFSLANVSAWGWGEKRIKNEISKCVIVCANCHRKIHSNKTKYSEVV